MWMCDQRECSLGTSTHGYSTVCYKKKEEKKKTGANIVSWNLALNNSVSQGSLTCVSGLV